MRKKARPFYNRFMTCHLNGIMTLEFSQFLEFSLISVTYFASPLMSEFFFYLIINAKNFSVNPLTVREISFCQYCGVSLYAVRIFVFIKDICNCNICSLLSENQAAPCTKS